MGQGLVSASLEPDAEARAGRAASAIEATSLAPFSQEAATDVPPVGNPPLLRFGKMFDLEAAFTPADDEGLIALGKEMLKGPDLGDHPSLPAPQV